MKKVFLAFVSVFVSVAMNAQIIKGDMNSNGKIDVEDVSLLVSTALGKTPQQSINASDMVDNSIIAGTWHNSNKESVTFNADGTTNYNGATNFKFIPGLNYLILCDAEGKATGVVNAVLTDNQTLCINGNVTYTKTPQEGNPGQQVPGGSGA